MDEERLEPSLRDAIIAYFEGPELVEVLEVPIEVVVELLEDYIIDSVAEIEDYMGLGESEVNDDEED